MKKTVLMTLVGAFLAAATVFAPAANAGYHHHSHYTHHTHYSYVSHCSWVKFYDHFGHHFYKKVCH